MTPSVIVILVAILAACLLWLKSQPLAKRKLGVVKAFTLYSFCCVLVIAFGPIMPL